MLSLCFSVYRSNNCRPPPCCQSYLTCAGRQPPKPLAMPYQALAPSQRTAQDAFPCCGLPVHQQGPSLGDCGARPPAQASHPLSLTLAWHRPLPAQSQLHSCPPDMPHSPQGPQLQMQQPRHSQVLAGPAVSVCLEALAAVCWCCSQPLLHPPGLGRMLLLKLELLTSSRPQRLR